MLKKMMSAVLLCAMIFALAVPATADLAGSSEATRVSSETVNDTGTQVDFKSALHVETLDLKVDGTPYIVLNPYSLTIEQNAITTGSAETSAQIIGGDMQISNKTKVPVIIGVKELKGQPTGNAVLASKSLADDTKTTTNSLFLFLSVAKTIDEARQATFTDDKTPENGMISISTTAKEKANLYKIDASSNGTTPQVAHLTITGNAIKSPAISWGGTDGVSVSFKLTAKMAEKE